MKLNSRTLSMFGVATAIVAVGVGKPSSSVKHPEALQRLIEGNARFVSGYTEGPNRDHERRATVAKGQHPFAIVVTCSDSRVCPEFIFDQGIGDLFVVRVAGNTVSPEGLGSIEYAVEHLGARLIIVMGHERCGAVDAAVKGGHLPGSIPAVVEPIKNAVWMSHTHPGGKLDAAINQNVRNMTSAISGRSEIVAEMVKRGELKIVGMRYDLDSGEAAVVPWMKASPKPAMTSKPEHGKKETHTKVSASTAVSTHAAGAKTATNQNEPSFVRVYPGR